MTGKSPKTKGKSPARTAEVFLMTAAAEAHQLVAEIAGPLELGGRIKTALAIVARKTGLTERRVRGIWHREARVIRADELDALRRAARAQEKAEHDAEMAELWAYVARLEERLAVADADFTGPHREALRSAVAPSRRLVDGD